jgi:hypothetical protein
MTVAKASTETKGPTTMTTLFKRVTSLDGRITITPNANLGEAQLEQGGHSENILLTEGAAADGGGLFSPLTPEEAQALRDEAKEQAIEYGVAHGAGDRDLLRKLYESGAFTHQEPGA